VIFAKFPMFLMPPLRGLSLEFFNGSGDCKTRMTPLHRMSKKSDDMSIHLHNTSTGQRDGNAITILRSACNAW